jgi:anti-anti-sigma factor
MYILATPNMFGRNRILGGPVLLSPNEALVAGGAAEAVEHQLQTLLRSGRKNLLLDLRFVSMIDSAGIRALVRAHTTAQRLHATFRVAGATAEVRRVLETSHLGSVFDLYESVDAARVVAWPWRTAALGIGGALLCATLVWVGLRWPLLQPSGSSGAEVFSSSGDGSVIHAQPFLELAKLVAAALIGVLVTAIHRPSSREPGIARSMAQAQILLCVSGALMMVLIGNSLPRAFGIAGAASIIRFRTPVDDPKDVTILFILMGLGMSTGLGALAVAGLGTGFLCLTLLALDRTADPGRRLMAVEVVAEGREFPSTRVEEVFARNHVVFEPREITQGKEVTVKFQTWLDPRTSLDDVSSQLMRDVPGIVAVGWQHAKRA